MNSMTLKAFDCEENTGNILFVLVLLKIGWEMNVQLEKLYITIFWNDDINLLFLYITIELIFYILISNRLNMTCS